MRRASFIVLLMIFCLVVWLVTRSGVFRHDDRSDRTATSQSRTNAPDDRATEESSQANGPDSSDATDSHRVSPAAESPPAVLDGNNWTVMSHATGKHNLHESRGFIAAFAGGSGAIVFVDDEHRFHLFDDDGWAIERTAEDLATRHRERLARALAATSRAARNYYYHLVADARGRIWWSNWSDAWGVVERDRAISGSTFDFGVGPKRRRRLEVLFPIGDEGRVLAIDDDFAGAVVDVDENSIVRVAAAPVVPKSWTLNDWSTMVLRDSRNRVWFNTHYMSENQNRLMDGGQSHCIGPDGSVLMQHDGWLQLEDRQHGLWFSLVKREPHASAIERLDATGKTTRFDLPEITGNLALAPDGGVWAMTDSEVVLLRATDSEIRVADRIPAPGRVKCGVWCDSANRVWLVREARRSALGHSDISVDELTCLIPGSSTDRD